jgi:uncharacterized protein
MEKGLLAQFTNQQYINLETFRRNGAGVKTPVWFVEENGVLYVRTGAKSGKVKRIRHNPQIRVVPCKGGGELLGDWVKAEARLVDTSDLKLHVNRLNKKKYGLQKFFFDLLGKIGKADTATLEIHLVP